MPLSNLLWVFLAFTFSGRDAPSMSVRVQGERTAHRCVELHRDLARKGGLGKSKSLRISVCFLGGVISNEANSYTILFTASSVF